MTPILERDGVKIYQDDDPMNPRTEGGNLGTMVCFHSRYDLGDKHEYNQETYNKNELETAIRNDHNPCIILPTYLLDHSGLAMNTTGFSCPWDSGQIGFIYCPQARALAEGVPFQDVERVLNQEVETYNQYLQGECYGYVRNVTKQYVLDRNDQILKNDEVLFRLVEANAEHADLVLEALNAYDPGESDACWGFYGYTPKALAEAVLKGEI